MRGKVNRVISAVVALVAACFAVIGSDLILWLKSKEIDGFLSPLLVVLLALICITLSERLAIAAIQTLKPIRDLIYGKYRIEGLWFGVALDPQRKVIREYALVVIEYDEGHLKPSGTLFDTQFRRIGDFSANLSQYNGRTLEYGYSRQVEHENIEQASGLGRYVFPKKQPHPLTYMGSFYDPDLKKVMLVRGMRITDRSVVKLIRSSKREDEVEVVKQLSQQFKGELSDYSDA